MYSIANALRRSWQNRGLLSVLLRPVSWIYRGIWEIRRQAFKTGLMRSEHPDVLVIVVGNVVVGGGGKTPVVIALADHFKISGKITAGIVSRGYGRVNHLSLDSPDIREVNPCDSADDVGDEPLMLRRRTELPVFVGRNRIGAICALLKCHPDVNLVICDDGLQHTALQRDIEICVFDNNGIGNGLMLPAGPLREPWPRPVNLILHTGNSPCFSSGFTSTRQLSDHLIASDGSLITWLALTGRPIHAIAGIATPESFFKMLTNAGVTLAQTTAFPDHYRFNSKVLSLNKRSIRICTEKDAVKLWQYDSTALAVPLKFTPTSDFFAALDVLVSMRLSSRTQP